MIDKAFVSVKDFAESSGIGQGFIRRVAHDNDDFPCLFVGRKLLIHKDNAMDWLIANKAKVQNT